jgi:hypothetical protein
MLLYTSDSHVVCCGTFGNVVSLLHVVMWCVPVVHIRSDMVVCLFVARVTQVTADGVWWCVQVCSQGHAGDS